MGIEGPDYDELERVRLEKERIEQQKVERKLYPNYSLFMIPSWSDLVGYPTLGTYLHHPVSAIVSDPVIFFSSYDYSIETFQGTLHYLFGLGYHYLKFEVESGKYITDSRILSGLVLTDFAYDHMAMSANVTLEDDREVIIAEKVVKIPIDLSHKTENQVTFIKGVLMRNIFIPNKDIFLEMMEAIKKEQTYQIKKHGHMLLSTHWDFFNHILVSELLRGDNSDDYLNPTAGINEIRFGAEDLLKSTISDMNLSIIEGSLENLKRIYAEVEFDPMYLLSVLENASKMLDSSTLSLSSDSTSQKQSVFISAEDRLSEFVSWPLKFKRKAKKEPNIIPKTLTEVKKTEQIDMQEVYMTSKMETEPIQESKFELESLKSEKVEFKTLPNPPPPEIKEVLSYLNQVIVKDYEMRAIGQAFEIARETMRKMGVSSTTTQQKKIWEMSKLANIYLKKEPGFGLPLKEKEDLSLKIKNWLLEIEEEERREKERLERERLERERLERLERERKERERLETERREQERKERERIEKERQRQLQLENERLQKLEEERQEKERLERERLEKQREELEAIEREAKELERLKKERKRKKKEAKKEAKRRKKLEKKRKKLKKKKLKEKKKLEKL